MERTVVVTVDATLITLIALMMATTVELFLFWNEHVLEYQDTMSDATLVRINRYLFRRIVYFCVLWWLYTKTITVQIPDSNPGSERTGLSRTRIRKTVGPREAPIPV